MSITPAGSVRGSPGLPRHLADAAEHEHLAGRSPRARARGAVGIDDQHVGLAELERARQHVVGRLGRQQHRDRAEPVDRA